MDFSLLNFSKRPLWPWGAIGAFDGCHIDRGHSYEVLLLHPAPNDERDDEREQFTDIHWTTGVHDARMLKESSFFAAWQEMMENRPLGEGVCLLLSLRPIEALTEVDQEQNSQISRGREVVDQASMVKMKVEASL